MEIFTTLFENVYNWILNNTKQKDCLLNLQLQEIRFFLMKMDHFFHKNFAERGGWLFYLIVPSE